MAALLTGVVSGIVTIMSFTQSYFPGGARNGNSPKTAVRVQVGMNDCAGGLVPLMILYNEKGEYIGSPNIRGHAKVGMGEFWDDIADMRKRGQPIYTLVLPHEKILRRNPNPDSICLAYISMVWPDGSRYVFVGDWLQECGATWSYSNILNPDGSPMKCVWMDTDDPRVVHISGFQMVMSQFSAAQIDSPLTPVPGTPEYCKTPILKTFTHDWWWLDDLNLEIYLNGFPSKNLSGLSRRDAMDLQTVIVNVTVPPEFFEQGAKQNIVPTYDDPKDRLIVSSYEEQPATPLCTSNTSRGADFVSLTEGRFCDMASKVVMDLCGETKTLPCFDLQKKIVIVSEGEGTRETMGKRYHPVEHWERQG